MTNNPSTDVANLGIAHPSPRGISMTNYSPISADAPLPTPLAGYTPEPGKTPPPQDDRS